MRKVLIVGATSAIAEAIARRLAADGDRLFLVARNPTQLAEVATDLEIRGAALAATAIMDADDVDAHSAVIDEADEALGGIDTALLAFGTLPDQRQCEQQTALAVRAWHTNAIAPMAMLTDLANRLEARGGGTLAAISSVAGERGRKSNYVYGSAKAALSTYLEGLRHRLQGTGVHVLTVKPGLIDTPMTAEFAKGRLWSTPERVANDVHRAIRQRRDVCYTPGFWAVIMFVIRTLPRWLYKRIDI